MLHLVLQSFDGNDFGGGAVLECDVVESVLEIGDKVRRRSKAIQWLGKFGEMSDNIFIVPVLGLWRCGTELLPIRSFTSSHTRFYRRNERSRGYIEYCIVEEDISFKIPKWISCEHSRTVPSLSIAL